MDRHTVNLNDTGIRFLYLKPRLLKCTKFTTEKLEDSGKAYTSRTCDIFTHPRRKSRKALARVLNLDLDRMNLYYRAKI